MTPAIQIRGLFKTFVLHNQGGAKLPVLRDVSFDVHAGECVVLDGPSGAGKSTLLKCIYANYHASSGAIIVNDGERYVDMTTAPARALIAMRRDTIGYVSQFLRVIPRVPAIDIVAEPIIQGFGNGANGNSARLEAEKMLFRLRIPVRLWGVSPATFSGGEQQRINIARGLIRPKRVLLLDEPTASLDADNRMTVTAMINEARAAGAAIIGIFHDQRVRDAVATRVIDISPFQVGLPAASGATSAIFTRA
jgi:alpha-D-ribose 1-methylphosphonate 5-triphosphate synthase subunit PhnL